MFKQKTKAQTKTPLEINRSGVFAIAWLPLAGGSIFLYVSANPSRKAGLLAVVPGMRIPAVSALPLGSLR